MARTGRSFPSHAKALWPGRTPFAVEVNRQLLWTVGGTVTVDRQLLWTLGGRVSRDLQALWEVAPSANRVSDALTGETRSEERRVGKECRL